ncbi:hypothetical protein [Serinibacter salmoneus]|uniref:Uncharacterized protein n=1 Tax=Serinibacter salmoneus TaxID=556530 RepID=A0A2A9D4S5_9MICO|nr:hypothetical protein [Serinibacter salmoneus]PFG21255.1 hypothetical protein ATL40_2878 [Serinibacter salmoneus]
MSNVEAAREWAKGNHPREAGVELLARSGLLYDGAPWVTGGRVVGAVLIEETQGQPGGVRRLVTIAASLLFGDSVDLSDEVPRLDRHQLELVLAAIAHAGGSHEHSTVIVDDDGYPAGFPALPSLYDWPQTKSGE